MKNLKWLVLLAAATLMFSPSAVQAAKTEGYIAVFHSHKAKKRHAAKALGKVKRNFKLIPGLAMDLDPSEAADLEKQTNVAYVEPDYICYALGDRVPYGIDLTRAPSVWPVARGAGAVVAVLDTGIDLNHPDNGNLIDWESFIYHQSVYDGHRDGHGTHVAGTVGAPENGLGVVGMAPQVNLLIGKVLANNGFGSLSSLLAGIDWAVASGANVINMSLGMHWPSQSLEAAVNNATEAGVLMVAAAGNYGTSSPMYPAGYPSVMSVTAVDQKKQRPHYTNYGPTIDIAAPGAFVLSTVPVGTALEATATWLDTDHEANNLLGSAEGTVTGEVYSCGLATGLDSDNSCPDSVAGNIAHIRRGSIFFADKVAHAASKGALGVIISNNEPGNFHGTIMGDSDLVIVSVTQDNGDEIEANLPMPATISVFPSDYDRLSGTSMAAPHVAGAAALLMDACGLTAEETREALETNAEDLGDPGYDIYYGYGLVDVMAALSETCPELVDSDGDGVSNIDDICLDTVPGELVDPSGCSLAQLCPCDTDWKNHGKYVSCLAKSSENFVELGLITEETQDSILSAAGSSTCGKR